MNAFWFALVQRTLIENNPFWFIIVCRTDMLFSLVRIDSFWFAIVWRTDTQIRNILRIHIRTVHILRFGHLYSYRADTNIKSRHTLCRMFFYIEVTIIRYMFETLPHINLMRQILKFLNNPRNILKTEITNGKPRIFNFLWPYNGRDTQTGNQPLYWSSKIYILALEIPFCLL